MNLLDETNGGVVREERADKEGMSISSEEKCKALIEGIRKEPKEWVYVLTDYEIIEGLGCGSFGQVVKARHKNTGRVHAVKLIHDVMGHWMTAKQTAREIGILRKLSEDPQNIFTTKLTDVIVPPLEPSDQLEDKPDFEELKNEGIVFNELFLVQDFFGSDM